MDKTKYLSLAIALSFYLVRLLYFDLKAPHYLTSIESMSWIFTVFGFGYKYLNRPSKTLAYLSEAVYPVYIVHMIFLYAAACLIFPLELSVFQSLILIILYTFIGSFVTFEIIRRVPFLRLFFGLKKKKLNKIF